MQDGIELVHDSGGLAADLLQGGSGLRVARGVGKKLRLSLADAAASFVECPQVPIMRGSREVGDRGLCVDQGAAKFKQTRAYFIGTDHVAIGELEIRL
jgi:hypothetical protein